MSLVVRLVREPLGLLDEPPARVALPLVVLTIVCGFAFGAAVGWQHSPLQALSSGLKLPLVLLVPLIVALPVLAALAHTLQFDLPVERAVVGGLACVARIALFAAAAAPVMWLFASAQHRYSATLWWAVVTLGCSGLFGVDVLGSAPVPRTHPGEFLRRTFVLLCAVAVFGTLAAQTAWLLRPLVLRPHLEWVLFEYPESDVFTELLDRL